MSPEKHEMVHSQDASSKSSRNISAEALLKLLQLLSSDASEAGRLYARLHAKLTALFNMKGVADPEGAADETIDRAALKIAAGAVVPDVDNYCLGIARNIARERFRHMLRESLAFRGFIDDLNRSSAEQVERIYELLKPCFELLTAEEQQLLAVYCAKTKGRERVEQRRALAEAMQITAIALRVRVTRLRSNLTRCVRKRSNHLGNQN